MIPASQPDPLSPQFAQPVPKKSSAVKAGWICLVLGFLTFWIFGFGFIFFVTTFILAIVAMSTQRVGQGIALLVSSIGASVICGIFSLVLLTNAFTAALQKERAKRLAHATPRVQLHQTATTETPQLQHATPTETSLHDLLDPPKGSLIVNINTASDKELRSLPSIGYARADEIIAHRPYASVDELSRVKGITPRVLDQLRPFVKTDGATEPRSP
jgi:DNA uptake protein ComE-like DNA-binding protein